ncbi:hypothetical protein AB0H63_20040 [Micromonospora echinospora]|uniref:hypothetical protein n=1 Tax=Micromonospora echinospora TaxID=1877 RepID=UPI0033F07CC2
MQDEPQATHGEILVGGINFTEKTIPESNGLHVPWSRLSLGLLAVTITSLGTLSVIVGIKDVDILSTVALALAVLAFAAQLIVSLAQAQGSAQQLTQTERVNSETKSALAEVKSTANALLTNQSDQFNQVLSALLRSATADAVREATEASAVVDAQEPDGVEPIDPEAVAERVEERVKKLLSHQPVGGVGSEARARFSGTLSEKAGSIAFEHYQTLSRGALMLFVNIASRTSESFRMVGLRSPTVDHPAIQELVNRGLLERRKEGSRNTQIVRVTNTGKILALLLWGDHFRDDWYWDELSRMAALGEE